MKLVGVAVCRGYGEREVRVQCGRAGSVAAGAVLDAPNLAFGRRTAPAGIGDDLDPPLDAAVVLGVVGQVSIDDSGGGAARGREQQVVADVFGYPLDEY